MAIECALGRLYEITNASGVKTRLLYYGNDLIAEYNASGAMLERYVHGVSGGDDPLIRYPGTNPDRDNAEYLYADRLGSVIASFDRFGNAEAVNSYDEFGVPGAPSGIANRGRFRYTGQMWIPELGQYHYKARAYSPTLGRFMQTDPIGYADGLNMYAYVGNDPLNLVDPNGLCQVEREFGTQSVQVGNQVFASSYIKNSRFVGCGADRGSNGNAERNDQSNEAERDAAECRANGGNPTNDGTKVDCDYSITVEAVRYSKLSPWCQGVLNRSLSGRRQVGFWPHRYWDDASALRFYYLQLGDHVQDGQIMQGLGSASGSAGVSLLKRGHPAGGPATTIGGLLGGLGSVVINAKEAPRNAIKHQIEIYLPVFGHSNGECRVQ